LARRSESQGFIVEVEDADGLKGFGEGTPRDYVTGETVAASENAATKLSQIFIGKTFKEQKDLLSFLEEAGNARLAMDHPSAFCALEIAVLDLFARKRNVPLWGLFVKKPAVDSLTYSSVLPLLDQNQRSKFLGLTGKLGLDHVKAKVSNKDQAVELVHEIFTILGPETDLRLDANGAFSWDEAVRAIEDIRKMGLRVSAFEQPVPKGDLDGLKRVEKQSSIPVIADESACTLEEMGTIISNGICSGLSIRLSKCGGILKCIKAIKMAKEAGLFCQLGCHVGETSILAAAGRQLASICGPFKYTEGSYSKFVLGTDITETPCEFSFGGHAKIPVGPGLGIDVSKNLLSSCSQLISETV